MSRSLESKSDTESRRSIHYIPLEDFLSSKHSFVEHAERKLLYNELAPFFDLAIARDSVREADFINTTVQNFSPEANSILDVGCGVGRHAQLLFGKYGYSVMGIDLSEQMIQVARQRCPKCNFRKMDMRSIELDQSFDVAICMWTTFNYLTNSEETFSFFRGIHSVLVNKGLLIIDIKNHQKNLRRSYRREARNSSFLVRLVIRKRVVENVSESIYNYLIKDLRTGEESFALDQELGVIYTKEDVIGEARSLFFPLKCHGDYDCSARFSPSKSNRIILVLRKVNNMRKVL